MELEDDAFFAHLSKQIAMIISEDEENEIPGKKFPTQCLPVQGYANFPQIITPQINSYEFACTRESRGTGVFIPKSSMPRRKGKQVKPQSTATIYGTRPFNGTISATSKAADGFNHINHNNYNKSGELEKLNV